MSITNAVEIILGLLKRDGYLGLSETVIEHHESCEHSFHEVILGQNARDTIFKKLSLESALQMVDSGPEEFSRKTFEIEELYFAYERQINALGPFHGEPDREGREVIIRRDEIDRNRISLSDLRLLIKSNAGESEIKEIIQKDPTILTDVYGHFDEYILFSEFPVATGRVDFVIFTGTSRMEVVFVEIKGADYNIITDNAYRDFSAKTNQACQQIRSRIGGENKGRQQRGHTTLFSVA